MGEKLVMLSIAVVITIALGGIMTIASSSNTMAIYKLPHASDHGGTDADSSALPDAVKEDSRPLELPPGLQRADTTH